MSPFEAPAELLAALRAAAGSDRLLVASDYDGTLAPIVTDPVCAWPEPGAVEVLTDLSQQASVTCAVVTGRERSVLEDLAQFGPAVITVGLHGGQWPDSSVELTAQQESALDRLHTFCAGQAATVRGHYIEPKPGGFGVHVRNCDPFLGGELLQRIEERATAEPGIHVRRGKQVLELSVLAATKGEAIERLRQQIDADCVVFWGDDTTDETVFEVMGPNDVSVKVGDGPTSARFRVAAPADVVANLAYLREQLTLPAG